LMAVVICFLILLISSSYSAWNFCMRSSTLASTNCWMTAICSGVNETL
jgi:hypothetical protein